MPFKNGINQDGNAKNTQKIKFKSLMENSVCHSAY